MFQYFYDQNRDLVRIRLDTCKIRSCWKANHWPVWMALHFERFEQYVRTREMQPGATLLGVADGAAIKMLRKRKPYVHG